MKYSCGTKICFDFYIRCNLILDLWAFKVKQYASQSGCQDEFAGVERKINILAVRSPERNFASARMHCNMVLTHARHLNNRARTCCIMSQGDTLFPPWLRLRSIRSLIMFCHSNEPIIYRHWRIDWTNLIIPVDCVLNFVENMHHKHTHISHAGVAQISKHTHAH
jgi:hypothetical protein